MGAGIIVVDSLSSVVGALIYVGAVWIIVLKCNNKRRPTSVVVEPTIGSFVERSGIGFDQTFFLVIAEREWEGFSLVFASKNH